MMSANIEIAKERGIEKNKPAFQLCGGTTLFLNSRFALHLVDHLSHCWAPGVSHFCHDEVIFFLKNPFCQIFDHALLYHFAQDFQYHFTHLDFYSNGPNFWSSAFDCFSGFLFSTFLVQAIHHCYVPSFNFASHFVAGSTYPLLWCLANTAEGYEAASSNISTLF